MLNLGLSTASMTPMTSLASSHAHRPWSKDEHRMLLLPRCWHIPDPPAQYGSDQRNFHNYGAAPGQYATSGQYNGSPAPYGGPNPFSAPPIPHRGQHYPSSNQGYGPCAAPYGAYGGADLRNLQRQPSQGPHFPQYPSPAQQSSFSPGQIILAQINRTQSPHELNNALPNPFASGTAAEHSTSATSSHSAGSPPPGIPEKQSAYLTHQPTQTGVHFPLTWMTGRTRR